MRDLGKGGKRSGLSYERRQYDCVIVSIHWVELNALSQYGCSSVSGY